MSQDFIAQYITTINNGIANTFPYYAEGQYHRAIQGLVPTLLYTITSDEEAQKTLDRIIEEVNEITKEAEKYRKGDTDSQRNYAYQQGVQLLSRNLYQDAIKQIKQAIKDDILKARTGYEFHDPSEGRPSP